MGFTYRSISNASLSFLPAMARAKTKWSVLSVADLLRKADAGNEKKAGPAGRNTRAAEALPSALGSGVHIRSQHELIKGTDSRYRSALRLMQRGGEVAKAYPLLVAAAEDGDALSVYAIGTWRLHGFHLKKNLREAVKLLRLAADADVAYACFDLAVCYQKGEGVKKDCSRAAKYYLRAFLLGDGATAEALETIF